MSCERAAERSSFASTSQKASVTFETSARDETNWAFKSFEAFLVSMIALREEPGREGGEIEGGLAPCTREPRAAQAT